MKKAKKSRGAYALRIELNNIAYHLERPISRFERREDEDALAAAKKRAKELGAVDQLAVATKALRAITNTATTDARSKGVAKAALEKMGVGVVR